MNKRLKRLATILGTVCALSIFSEAFAEEGVSNSQLLIGQPISLEGGKSEYGTAVLEGVQAALMQANRNGGVYGRQITLKIRDSENKAAIAESDARNLVTQDKVFILFGSIEGGPSTAVMKAAVDLNVPFFGPMAGSPELREPVQPLVFPVRTEHKGEFRALMAHAKSLGMQRVAFVRSATATGEKHLKNVQLLAKELGLQLVADLPFTSNVGAADIDAMAKAIAQSRTEMVFNHGSPGTYEKLIRRSNALQIKTHFYGVNSGSTQLASHLGELAHSMIFAQVVPSPWQRKRAITRHYQEAFARFTPGAAYSYGSLEGYITGRALIEALKRAGTQPTRSSFVEGLRNAELNVEGLRIKFDEHHHTGLDLVDLTIYSRNGTFIH
jgi:branched-chain amino acid transport system substrate-binding protein